MKKISGCYLHAENLIVTEGCGDNHLLQILEFVESDFHEIPWYALLCTSNSHIFFSLFEIMEITFSSNGHTVFTLCPVLWTGTAWHHDVVYADDISSWTIDEMIRLRDSWEYAY